MSKTSAFWTIAYTNITDPTQDLPPHSPTAASNDSPSHNPQTITARTASAYPSKPSQATRSASSRAASTAHYDPIDLFPARKTPRPCSQDSTFRTATMAHFSQARDAKAGRQDFQEGVYTRGFFIRDEQHKGGMSRFLESGWWTGRCTWIGWKKRWIPRPKEPDPLIAFFFLCRNGCCSEKTRPVHYWVVQNEVARWLTFNRASAVLSCAELYLWSILFCLASHRRPTQIRREKKSCGKSRPNHRSLCSVFRTLQICMVVNRVLTSSLTSGLDEFSAHPCPNILEGELWKFGLQDRTFLKGGREKDMENLQHYRPKAPKPQRLLPIHT